MALITNLYSALAQGTLWGIMALGVYITFRILDIADLSCDGTFALGGCISAILITRGVNPFVTLLFALVGGMLAGLVTGWLHTKLMIPAILAGILTMIALWSVNIRVMGGPNVSLLGEDTAFTKVMDLLGVDQTLATLVVGVIIGAIVIAALYWFFGTEIGCALRATGNNEFMVRALGGNTDTSKVLGLVISNGLISVSGALVAQNQGYGDIKMGTGSIVIGLASIVIGEVIFGKRFNFAYILASLIGGAMVYRMIISLVLHFGLSTDDMKLFTVESSAVYQGIARGMGIDLVYKVNQFAIGDTMPDLTIMIDLDAEAGISRKKKQAELDRMESETIDFHKKVVEGYRQLASLHPDRIYTVDGSLTIEEIHQKIVSQVNKKFHGKG